MFAWWNGAYALHAFTEAAFALHFAPELEFTVNGASRGRSCGELAASFRRVREATQDARICLPVIETFGAGDRIFVHYRLEAISAAGEEIEEAMACAVISGGLIARMTVLSREVQVRS
jgi:hypothetical protein